MGEPMDDLVKRLNSGRGDCRECGGRDCVAINSRAQCICEICLREIVPSQWLIDMHDAADAIEASARLIAEKDAEIARLRDALEFVSSSFDTDYGRGSIERMAGDRARAALHPPKQGS